MARLVLLCLVAISAAVVITDAAKIAAFNIQILGTSKMAKPTVVGYLKQILNRYDMILIQEIRDSSQTAIYDLLNQLNDYSNYNYEMALGPRVGRSTSKEQYAYFYRENKFRLDDAFSYSDFGDRFEREPYIALFTSLGGSTSVPQFSVVGIHTKPDDAVSEIDLLTDVYNAAVSRWSNSNSIIMGDFNADCNYVSSGEWSQISLRTDTNFDWLISDSKDTTVKSTNCAYDRIVLAGSYVKDNAGGGYVFDYQSYYGISQSMAEDISDHYPVYFNLY